MMVDRDEYKLQIQMMQERFDEQEQIPLILKMLEESFQAGRIFERGYKEGYHQGDVDNNPIYDHAIGGFHGV
jgi:hypothetical protein